jgi:aspartyl/asparaginyl beta-hydroxylase (cupin superfamily)
MQVWYDAQEWVETHWPLPSKGSSFNLSVRDVLITLLVVFVCAALQRHGFLWLALPALALEPAILAFPMNVAQSFLLRTPRFWDALTLEPKLQWLLDSFPALQAETRAVVETPQDMPFFADVSNHQQRIAGNQPWRVFPLFAYGHTNWSNCAKMPVLSSLVMQIPSVRLAMLSMMEEGTEIAPHCGFFKSVLRVHLTLLTDVEDTEGKRFIEVGGERHSWKQGELVAFDDTFPHRVSNRVPGRRVVLFLDIDRPFQTRVAELFGRGLLALMRSSPSVKSHAALQERPKT